MNIRKYIFNLFWTIVGAVVFGWWTSKLVERNKQLSNKHFALFSLMDKWVELKQQNKSISSFLENNHYNHIAIYGMGKVGERLIKELDFSDIQIQYAIDRNVKNSKSDLKIITPEDTLSEVDAIVVTAITFFDEIKEALLKKINCPIVSLEDIFDEM